MVLATLCHSNTRHGEEKLLTRTEKIKKKERQKGQGAAANAWGDHDTESKSQRGSNLGNDGKGKAWLYRLMVS